MYEEAILFLQSYVAGAGKVYPMIHYALGYFYACQGDNNKALDCYRKAEQDDHSYCFPNRIEEVVILQNALSELRQLIV